ncbi:MAG: hypothetical protein ACPLW9_02100 [Minisyncoccales bacterium]
MARQIIFYFLFFYFLVLLQTSFLIYFHLHHPFFNLALITVIILNLFGSFRTKIISALSAGFFLDIFSLGQTGFFFGFYFLSLLALAFFLEFVFKKYIRHPLFSR